MNRLQNCNRDQKFGRKNLKVKRRLRMQLLPSPVYPALHIHINVFPDGIHSPFTGLQSLPMHGSISRSRKKNNKKINTFQTSSFQIKIMHCFSVVFLYEDHKEHKKCCGKLRFEKSHLTQKYRSNFKEMSNDNLSNGNNHQHS